MPPASLGWIHYNVKSAVKQGKTGLFVHSVEKIGFLAENRRGGLIRVFNKTLKSVLLGRRIAASGHCR